VDECGVGRGGGGGGGLVAMLNPMEKKNFGLYENGSFCATIIKKRENSGNLKRKQYATISGQLSLVEGATHRP